MSRRLFAGAIALAISTTAIPTFAHVSADPAEAQPGSYFRTALRVPHGCNGQPTTAIRVGFPDGIVSVKAQAKPGWKVQSETKTLLQPVSTGHGKQSHTAPSAVSWSGGSLPDDQFDEFGLVLKLPDAPGTQFWLPVVQTCAQGEVRWDQIPAAGQSAHDLERPAAVIRIADTRNASALKVGDIQIQQPYARATPAKIGGVFMILQNAGKTTDRLVKAASSVAENVELHTNVKDGDTMRMRPVDAIDVPAQGKTELAPGGYHVMLIGLKQPLKDGERFALTLTFEKAGMVTIDVPVTKAGAAGGHHHH